MRQNSILFLFLFAVFFSAAQERTEYIKNGDEAMNLLDYGKAKIWFEALVNSSCDTYGIMRLKDIWYADDSMRLQMSRGNVMKKCLSCLEDNVKSLRDSSSMNLLILFYSEGIGTDKDDAMAAYWKQRLDEIKNPNLTVARPVRTKPPREKVQMKFFTGYSASMVAPVGLTVGGVGNYVGWYLRFRSNLSSQEYTKVCDNAGNIDGGLDVGFAKFLFDETKNPPKSIKKSNALIGTGGLVIKVNEAFLISIGAGYCNREVIYQLALIGEVEAKEIDRFWAKNKDASIGGVALDLDGKFKIGKTVYASLGCTVFDFKKVYPNAGIGIFF